MRGARRAAAATLAGVLGVGMAQLAAGASPPAHRSFVRTVEAAVALPAGAVLIGHAAGSSRLTVELALAPRSPAALARFVASVSSPASRTYRHYLGRGAFGARFGPTVSTIRALRREAAQLGLRTGAPSEDRLLLPVRTTVAGAERAFQTDLVRVRLRSGRVGVANVTATTLPASMAAHVVAIVGLSDVTPLLAPGGGAHAPSGRAASGRVPHTAGPMPCTGATGTGAATANVVASAYGLDNLYGLGDLGAGQTIAVFEPAAYSTSDVAAYQSCFKTSTAVSVTPVDGGVAVGDGTLEATADVEDLIGIAPSAGIHVYETANYFETNWLDEWARIVNDDAAQVISTSWLSCESYEPTGFASAERTYFLQAAAQGQTVLAADGDYGAEGCDQQTSSTALSVDDPSSDPYVEAIGGTQWTSLAPRSGEAAWNNGDGASGGGISTNWTMPSWQSGAGVVNGFSSGTPCANAHGDCRETPDVSALSGPPYYAFYCSQGDCSGIGGWGYFYGTSFATPLWAASVALSNESCAGGPPAGFLDPALYDLATADPSLFHDVTTGNTDFTGTNGGDYPATAGYDLATGIGTPSWSTGTSTPGLASALCGLLRLPSWPMFHQGASHAGLQPAETTLSATTVAGLVPRWNHGAGTDPIVVPVRLAYRPPVEVELTSTSSGLTAYAATTGTVLWHFAYAPDGPVAPTSAPAASTTTGLVYVGFDRPSSHAVDAVRATTGKLAWRVAWPTRGAATCAVGRASIAGPLTVAGNLLLGQTTGGCVFALNARTGTTLWVTDGTRSVRLRGATAPTEFAVSSTLSEVLVGTTPAGSTSPGRLVALNATTGAYRFSVSGCDGGSSTPARVGATVFASGARGLCAVSVTTGAVAWTNGCGVNASSSPVVSGTTAITVATPGTGKGRVCAVSVTTGKVLWSLDLGAASSPAAANGVVYLTAARGTAGQPWGVVALNATGGSVLYASDAATSATSPAIASGWVYVAAIAYAT
jgi:outer membrane protein assembly factor BamB